MFISIGRAGKRLAALFCLTLYRSLAYSRDTLIRTYCLRPQRDQDQIMRTIRAIKYTHIYGLIDPRTNQLRYIGKADSPNIRLNQHLKHQGR